MKWEGNFDCFFPEIKSPFFFLSFKHCFEICVLNENKLCKYEKIFFGQIFIFNFERKKYNIIYRKPFLFITIFPIQFFCCYFGHRWKIYKDIAGDVWKFSSPRYEVLFEFCSFLCISLNVLVSFSHSYRNFKKIEKSH